MFCTCQKAAKRTSVVQHRFILVCIDLGVVVTVVWVARPRAGSEFRGGGVNKTANFFSFICVLCVPSTSVCGLCCRLMLHLCEKLKSSFIFANDRPSLKTYGTFGV